MQEISRQLSSQVLPSLLPKTPAGALPGNDEENPFFDTPTENTESIELSVSPAHMHMLIACIPTLGQLTIIVLDAFDLFAQHPCQSLLYSLFNTVQSLRAGGGNKGLAVIGITTRIDSSIRPEFSYLHTGLLPRMPLLPLGAPDMRMKLGVPIAGGDWDEQEEDKEDEGVHSYDADEGGDLGWA
ncbi:hypothetical protein BT96DRAFT_999347 [Gymnopus androsaceus JB14]|uniref:Uncharacterized protein n=1 Tax=Gymnopus androsaceus JB14 TaxID=1447944 RepID=A0A6A4H637_9AGAR|nr:hypothetical protein BT96DRAFT_999347 [Gymnopus androsaceus JB14]